MTIEERLNRLERENRTWRIACVALVLLAGTIVSCSDSTDRSDATTAISSAGKTTEIPDVIRANRIETTAIMIRNGTDTKAAALLPGALLLQEGGETRIAVLSGPDGGELQVFNDNAPVMSVVDKTKELEKPAAVKIGAGADGGGNVHICNRQGTKVAILQSNKVDMGVLYVFDAKGETMKGYGP